MINGKRLLAIILARGGSKGLPGKNIKSLCNKPLIAWTIEEAKKSKFIDKVIVSSDDMDIIRISKEYGAEIPFIRSKELASDTAKGIDAIKHAVGFFQTEFKIVIVLQPTSPLREVYDIDNAIQFFMDKKASAVVSVCELEHPIQWVGTLPEDLCMVNFTENNYKNTNRQELGKYYRYNGAIYISNTDYLLENNGFLGKKTYAYIMNTESSIDIDNLLDFKFAEFILKDRKNEII